MIGSEKKSWQRKSKKVRNWDTWQIPEESFHSGGDRLGLPLDSIVQVQLVCSPAVKPHCQQLCHLCNNYRLEILIECLVLNRCVLMPIVRHA